MTVEGLLAAGAVLLALLWAIKRMPRLSGDGRENTRRPEAPASGHDYLHAEPGSEGHEKYWELRQRERERREAEQKWP
jgi:hypothetical protein